MPEQLKYFFGGAGVLGGLLVIGGIVLFTAKQIGKYRGPKFNGGNPLRTFESVPSGRPRGEVKSTTF